MRALRRRQWTGVSRAFAARSDVAGSLPVWQCLLVLVLLVAAGACARGVQSGCGVPASQDTLARFLPLGTPIPELEPSESPQVCSFSGQGADGAFRGEMSSSGTLLWWASDVEAADLPEEIRLALASGAGVENPKVERARILAFEIEVDGVEETAEEWFVDAFGNLLFDVEASPEAEEEDLESFDEVDAAVAGAITAHVGSRPVTSLTRSVELGTGIYEAEWNGSQGPQEVKVFGNGLTFFVELPKNEPIPEEVLKMVPPRGGVEALVLEAFWVRSAADSVLLALLGNGRWIVPPRVVVRPWRSR